MSGGRPGRDVVLCLVSDTFADTVRRDFYSTADQTLLSLIASEKVRRILVVDHPRGVLSQMKRRAHGDRPAARSGKLRGLRPLAIATQTPRTPEALSRRYRAFDAQIALATAAAGMRSPFLVTFNLFHAAFGARPREGANLFYAQDDETALPGNVHRRPMIQHAYERVAERYANVAAVSGELLGRINPQNHGVVIANGIDPDLWHTVTQGVARRGDCMAEARPVAVYAGTIDARLDVAALESMAASGFRVVLAGPVNDAAVGARLGRSCVLLGSVPRSEIRTLLVGADVCVLAHVRSPLTEAMSPLKLFEYMASGTPVVAADLAGVREAWSAPMNGELVSRGGDYAASARKAMARGRLTEDQRRQVVERISWRVRHRSVISMLTLAQQIS